MHKPQVNAVLFARDLGTVAAFYEHVFGVHPTHRDEDYAVLEFDGFELVIHQIPSHLIEPGTFTIPPERRERSAMRLNFPVADMTLARHEAQRLGGLVDELPPQWAGTDTSFFLGHDPEGNVFGAMTS